MCSLQVTSCAALALLLSFTNFRLSAKIKVLFMKENKVLIYFRNTWHLCSILFLKSYLWELSFSTTTRALLPSKQTSKRKWLVKMNSTNK